MTDEQLKTVYQLYADLWRLFKAYHDAKTDEQWDECTEQGAKLVEKIWRGCKTIDVRYDRTNREEM